MTASSVSRNRERQGRELIACAPRLGRLHQWWISRLLSGKAHEQRERCPHVSSSLDRVGCHIHAEPFAGTCRRRYGCARRGARRVGCGTGSGEQLSDARIAAITRAFAAPGVGLEPTTYGLTVRCNSSTLVHQRPRRCSTNSSVSANDRHRPPPSAGSAVRSAVNAVATSGWADLRAEGRSEDRPSPDRRDLDRSGLACQRVRSPVRGFVALAQPPSPVICDLEQARAVGIDGVDVPVVRHGHEDVDTICLPSGDQPGPGGP